MEERRICFKKMICWRKWFSLSLSGGRGVKRRSPWANRRTDLIILLARLNRNNSIPTCVEDLIPEMETETVRREPGGPSDLLIPFYGCSPPQHRARAGLLFWCLISQVRPHTSRCTSSGNHSNKRGRDLLKPLETFYDELL